MRIFIAIDLPSAVKREIEKNHKTIAANCRKSRIISTGNLHLTLKFLGEVEENRLERVKRIMNEVAANVQRFELSTANWGKFKSRKGHIIWLGVGEAVNELRQLAQRLNQGLKSINEPAGFSFQPHITVARDALIDKDPADWKQPAKISWTVRQIILYESVYHKRTIYYVKHRTELTN